MKDFRYNAWYGPENAPTLDAASYRLTLAGLIANKQPWTVEQLYALPQVSAGHAPCLRRGLEHDRQMDRHAVANVL